MGQWPCEGVDLLFLRDNGTALLPWKDFLPVMEAQREGCCAFSVFRSLWKTERKAQVQLVVLCWGFVRFSRDPLQRWCNSPEDLAFTSKFRCDSGKSTLAVLEQVRECPTGMGTEVPLLTELHLLRWLGMPLDGQLKPGNPREGVFRGGQVGPLHSAAPSGARGLCPPHSAAPGEAHALCQSVTGPRCDKHKNRG